MFSSSVPSPSQQVRFLLNSVTVPTFARSKEGNCGRDGDEGGKGEDEVGKELSLGAISDTFEHGAGPRTCSS